MGVGALSKNMPIELGTQHHQRVAATVGAPYLVPLRHNSPEAPCALSRRSRAAGRVCGSGVAKSTMTLAVCRLWRLLYEGC